MAAAAATVGYWRYSASQKAAQVPRLHSLMLVTRPLKGRLYGQNPALHWQTTIDYIHQK
jgi:hypothetical protein